MDFSVSPIVDGKGTGSEVKGDVDMVWAHSLLFSWLLVLSCAWRVVRAACRVASLCRKGGHGLALIFLLASGCSQSMDLSVGSSPPVPVVTPLPLSVGLYYDDAFRAGLHREASEDRGQWQIDIGQAQRNLFDNVIGSMFDRTQEVEDIADAARQPIDVIIAPELLQVELALPEETQTDFYEAWLKYRVKLLSTAGEPITAWDIAGYGKVTKSGMFTSKEAHLSRAIDDALRSIGAGLALGFVHQQGIKMWLCGTRAAALLSCTEVQQAADQQTSE